MALQSILLAGNARLEQAAGGGPSVKKRPPDDEPDAVRRIQRALVELGFKLPLSFPNGYGAEPDGLYGNETYQAVMGYQKREFPDEWQQWDGRVGKNTLARMDAQLSKSTTDEKSGVRQPLVRRTTSCCEVKGDSMARNNPPGRLVPGLKLPGLNTLPGLRRG